jgi:alpha-beta hydrolase superfamily lysophospholipase
MTAAVTTADGTRLFVRRWAASGDAWGTVQIVHGLGEHIGRYAALAEALNAAGWHVLGHDHRGHGQSTGARGAIPAADTLLQDLAAVMDAHRTRHGRHVLLGHSMGGLVAARFVAEGLQTRPAAWFREVDGLVLSSPALDAGMNMVHKLKLALLGPLAPDLAQSNGLNPDWISRDPAVVHAYVADPLVHDRVTARLVQFIVDGGRAVQAAAPRWTTPTLLMWAGADRCVAPQGSARFAAAARPAFLTARPFGAMFHEIFNEPERAEVVAQLIRWLTRLDSVSPIPAPHRS